MKTCCECGGDLVEKKSYRWDNERLGSFIILKEKYLVCEECGDVLIPLSVAQKVEDMEAERVSQLLYNRFSNMNELNNIFLSNQELVAMFGTTRQAVAKNPRVKTLIYNFSFKGITFYLKESAEQFVATGDGRIKLKKEDGNILKSISTREDGNILKVISTREDGNILKSTSTFSPASAPKTALTMNDLILFPSYEDIKEN